MGVTATKSRRVRRSPESAKAEIIAAFEEALAETGFNELTVDAVMQRTGMTRPSFYYYFTALDDLVLGLLERFEEDVRAVSDPWLDDIQSDDYRKATVDGIMALAAVYQTHRRTAMALLQSAWANTELYRSWQQRVIEHYIERTTRVIEEQVARGRSRVEDPPRLARALNLMTNAVFNDHILRNDPDDVTHITKVVAGIWNTSIYG